MEIGPKAIKLVHELPDVTTMFNSGGPCDYYAAATFPQQGS